MARSASSKAVHSGSSAFRLRAWDNPAIEQGMIEASAIAIGGEGDIGDASALSVDEIRRQLQSLFPSRSRRGIGKLVGYWKQFRDELAIDDIVAVPMSGRKVAIARVEGDYEFRPNATPHLRHVRRVEWLALELDRSIFDDDIRRILNSPGTICRIAASDAVTRLATAATEGRDPGSARLHRE